MLIKTTKKASDSLMQVKFQIQSVNTCGLTYMPIVQFCAGNPTLVKDTCNVRLYLKKKQSMMNINNV